MSNNIKNSAGILLYRFAESGVEYLLARPGGPYYVNQTNDIWTIPKGEMDDGENVYQCALREFQEETSIELPKDNIVPVYLGTITQKSGKIVYAWAVELSLDVSNMRSNHFQMEWPKNSGKIQSFPEVDLYRYFNLEEAKVKIKKAQITFLERLNAAISTK